MGIPSPDTDSMGVPLERANILSEENTHEDNILAQWDRASFDSVTAVMSNLLRNEEIIASQTHVQKKIARSFLINNSQ